MYHVLKTDGVKLFNDLLKNKIFSKQILSWNFKMNFCSQLTNENAFHSRLPRTVEISDCQW